MSVARYLLLPLLIVILIGLVTFGVVATATASVITDREQVKLALANPKIYAGLSQALVEGTLSDFEADQYAPSPDPDSTEQLDRLALNKVISRYFTVDFYNRALTNAVDGVYDWLDGKTASPSFNIPITEDKQQFQDFIVSVFSERFNSLPACPTGTPITPEFNPLEASCQPAGYSQEHIRNFIVLQTDQPEFSQLVNNAAITSDSFIGDLSGDDTANLQGTYRALKLLPWLVPLLIIISSGLIMLIQFNRNRGLKTIGLTILPASLLIFGLALIANVTKSSYLKNLSANPTPTPSDIILQELIGSLYEDINNRILIYSLGLIITAVEMLIF